MVFFQKMCLIGFNFKNSYIGRRRKRVRVLLVLTFGEGAGVEKVKSLKEIKTQFCGKDIVVIRVL